MQRGGSSGRKRRSTLLGSIALAALALASAAGCQGQEGGGRAEVQQLIDELLPRIEEVSGLHASKPIRFQRPSRAEIRGFVERQLDDEMPPEDLDATRRVYADLGLVPDTLDLRGLLLDLYTEQVVGYYDPKTETLYVVNDVPVDSILPVLSHELVHALQDQYVDLDALVVRERGNDRQTAAQAAMEGQATVLMIALMAAQVTGEPTDVGDLPDIAGQWGPIMEAGYEQYPVFRSAPRILRETLLFPYIRGAAFIQALDRAVPEDGDGYRPPPFPWDTLLPLSTEQVLHPGTAFLAHRDAPTEVTLGEPAAPWRIRYSDTLGELEVGIFLTEHLGQSGASLARGWDGDRYALLEDGAGHTALAWYSVWDDDAAADRFARGYRRTLEHRPGRRASVERSTVQARPVVRIIDVPAGQDPAAVGVPPLTALTEDAGP